MNRKQAIRELKKLQVLAESDQEMAHSIVDDVICKLLETLGYQDVIEEYYDVPK